MDGMTRDELLAALRECLATAPKTTSKAIRTALGETIAFLESPVAAMVAGDAPGLPVFQQLARQCADELDEAANLTIGVMDSDSKAAAVNAQRLGAMQSVAARLREA